MDMNTFTSSAISNTRIKYIQHILDNPKEFHTFKSCKGFLSNYKQFYDKGNETMWSNKYGWPIEPLPKEMGITYAMHVMNNNPSLYDKLDLLHFNDHIGDKRQTEVCNYHKHGNISPLSLKYLKVHCDLEEYFGSISDMHVVEIGAGFGGQTVISSLVSGFASWTHIDKPEMCKLQEKYINTFNKAYPDMRIDNCSWISYEDGWENNLTYPIDLVVSCHCVEWLDEDIQDDYIDNLCVDSRNGYFESIFHSDTTPNSLKEKCEKKLHNVQEFPEPVITNHHRKMTFIGNGSSRDDKILIWENNK